MQMYLEPYERLLSRCVKGLEELARGWQEDGRELQKDIQHVKLEYESGRNALISEMQVIRDRVKSALEAEQLKESEVSM